jgi:hypothetical protein
MYTYIHLHKLGIYRTTTILTFLQREEPDLSKLARYFLFKSIFKHSLAILLRPDDYYLVRLF